MAGAEPALGPRPREPRVAGRCSPPRAGRVAAGPVPRAAGQAGQAGQAGPEAAAHALVEAVGAGEARLAVALAPPAAAVAFQLASAAAEPLAPQLQVCAAEPASGPPSSSPVRVVRGRASCRRRRARAAPSTPGAPEPGSGLCALSGAAARDVPVARALLQRNQRRNTRCQLSVGSFWG